MIDLSELLRLLWSHVLQIVAVGLVAAVISFLVCTFALTPRYQASVNMIVNTRQDNTTTVSTDNITSAKNMIDTYAGDHQEQPRAQRCHPADGPGT